MKMELQKVTGLDLSVWYYVMIDGACPFASQDYEKAKANYELFKGRALEGYPKTEVLESLIQEKWTHPAGGTIEVTV